MINAKLYMITSPTLAQACFRSKNMSFEPFSTEFGKRMIRGSDEMWEPVLVVPPGSKHPGLVTDIIKEIHGSMMNEHLHAMNAVALGFVANTIRGLGQITQTRSIYLWLRDLLSAATCASLFGSHSPFTADPSLVDSLWYVNLSSTSPSAFGGSRD